MVIKFRVIIARRSGHVTKHLNAVTMYFADRPKHPSGT